MRGLDIVGKHLVVIGGEELTWRWLLGLKHALRCMGG
jgi:hypothetical protein